MIALRARASGMSRLSAAYGLFTALTAFAVVYLGEHFVLDAIAGIVLAWFVVKVSARFNGAAVREVPIHREGAAGRSEAKAA
jgi:membrane-associated phospholipid phosphatase